MSNKVEPRFVQVKGFWDKYAENRHANMRWLHCIFLNSLKQPLAWAITPDDVKTSAERRTRPESKRSKASPTRSQPKLMRAE